MRKIKVSYDENKTAADAFVDAGSPDDPVDVTVLISRGVRLVATPSQSALSVHGFAPGSNITVISNGSIDSWYEPSRDPQYCGSSQQQ